MKTLKNETDTYSPWFFDKSNVNNFIAAI